MGEEGRRDKVFASRGFQRFRLAMYDTFSAPESDILARNERFRLIIKRNFESFRER